MRCLDETLRVGATRLARGRPAAASTDRQNTPRTSLDSGIRRCHRAPSRRQRSRDRKKKTKYKMSQSPRREAYRLMCVCSHVHLHHSLHMNLLSPDTGPWSRRGMAPARKLPERFEFLLTTPIRLSQYRVVLALAVLVLVPIFSVPDTVTFLLAHLVLSFFLFVQLPHTPQYLSPLSRIQARPFHP